MCCGIASSAFWGLTSLSGSIFLCCFAALASTQPEFSLAEIAPHPKDGLGDKIATQCILSACLHFALAVFAFMKYRGFAAEKSRAALALRSRAGMGHEREGSWVENEYNLNQYAPPADVVEDEQSEGLLGVDHDSEDRSSSGEEGKSTTRQRRKQVNPS
jgi:hypothetical protein